MMNTLPPQILGVLIILGGALGAFGISFGFMRLLFYLQFDRDPSRSIDAEDFERRYPPEQPSPLDFHSHR